MNDVMPVLTAIPNAPALRNPNEIVEEARQRADVLMAIVREKNLSKQLSGKEHIQIEAWQTVARFYGCTAGSSEAESVEIDRVKGAKAKAFVKDEKTGVIVSEAIAYCMRDEPNWRNKPWFQLASMAQTRAMSKALSSKFRWVAVLAGFSGTPAEEMESPLTPFEQNGGPSHGSAGSYSQETSSGGAASVSDALTPFIWRMGKWKGAAISEVDANYLSWAAQNMTREDHKIAAQQELDRRHAQEIIDLTEPADNPA